MDIFTEKTLKPMLLDEKDKPFNNSDYLYEIKFDGIRALIYLSNEEIIIKSRNGKDITKKFPELESLKKITYKKCIFDGEIILMNNGRPSFQKLQERLFLKDEIKLNYIIKNNPVTFICFDILYENKSLIDLPLITRKERLKKYKDTKYFVKSLVANDGIKLYKLIKKQNLEGIVIKKKNSKYYPNKRTKEWIKIKCLKEKELYICGYKEEKNNISLILCEKIDNEIIFITKVRLNKNRSEYKLIMNVKRIDNYIKNFKQKNYIFIKPVYKCLIIYLEETNNKHLRQPIFKELKKD